jgi:alkylated DNA repair dioxygenase AlkB
MDLFSSEELQNEQHLELPDAKIVYFPNFLSTEEATYYFSTLKKETTWQHDDIKVFGKTYKQPRLTALYGDEGKSYSYSNITMHPTTFTTALLEIKNKIESICDAHFNVVLLNLYRDGSDSNGWHSDDEKELGKNPVIASVSLGTKRVFQLRNKENKKLRHNLELTDGSLLLMRGSTQHFWQHQIPKTKKVIDPRINLTFRCIP